MAKKNIPPRASKIAEEDAKKVRMEPPKATRQEAPLVAKGKDYGPSAQQEGNSQSCEKPRVRIWSISRCRRGHKTASAAESNFQLP